MSALWGRTAQVHPIRKTRVRASPGTHPIGRRHFRGTLDLLARANVPIGPRPVQINRQGPGSGLSPHSDNLNFLLVCHLGVDCPSGCRFLMHGDDGEVSSSRRWSDGKLLIADTSFRHSTVNRGARSRYVLHFSVWHPQLSRAEREGVLMLHEALASLERQDGDTGSVVLEKG